jgi:hypothetical protein
MKLTAEETRFLTVLIREQNQTGCRGPAHDLLRRHAYPDAPLAGPNSLGFAYDAVPLTGVLVQDFTDFQDIDDFLRKAALPTDVSWPWSSADEYRARLEEARQAWTARKGTTIRPAVPGADVGNTPVPSRRTGASA